MAELDPVAVEASLAAYYDDEGDERLSRPLDPRRVAKRDAFIASLAPSSRVLEIGSGPGRDMQAFVDAGHRCTAVDRSLGHATRCAATGAAVTVASVRALPFASRHFDAVWTMSTLMHVPDVAIDAALAELFRVLVTGGIATIGVWGGPDIELFSAEGVRPERPARFFSRRAPQRWRSMLERHGDVTVFEVWDDGVDNDGTGYVWGEVRAA